MKLTSRQLQDLERDGFLVLPGLFSREEVDLLRSRQERLLAETHEANIVEKNSGKVRTAMGLHLRDEAFARLVRHPRLVEPARQVRSPALYIQQVKINVKAAFTGEAWQWHYDFATHHADDGVPEPLALNLHVFLDTVTPFNGPLYFIPGSHAFPEHDAWHDTESTSYPLWVVENRAVKKLVARAASINPDRPIVQATGAPGTGLIFFDTVVHGSPGNMSPWDRSIFSLILNPVDNALTRFDRPDFKHHRDLRIVDPLDDDCLVS
ncbi:MAG: proline hydroxylase [Gammaproteobacteria bacterium]|nr:proline hydroxylase [Gammaproteobacteria bacterium]MYD75592.1 proline hydroxylase [Gammaproteobacteria bacterium]MYJ51360.1 proline hydroxylase [Gammaproteobacteria bacterium]